MALTRPPPGDPNANSWTTQERDEGLKAYQALRLRDLLNHAPFGNLRPIVGSASPPHKRCGGLVMGAFKDDYESAQAEKRA